MTGWQRLACRIDKLTEHIGRAVAWLALVIMLISCLIVILRYGLSIGSIALQESRMYLHACLIMLGGAYTLMHKAHVRVDILYHRISKRAQAWIDCLGTVFLLLPFCVLVFYVSWEYVMQSIAIIEGSHESGGIRGVFLLKSLLLVMPFLLILQAISQLIHSIHTIRKKT